MEMYSLDVEIFKNYSLFVFVDISSYFDIRTNKINENTTVKEFEAYILDTKKFIFHIGFGVNDINKIIAFANRNIIIASFNGLDYDNILVNACIANINKWKTIDYINIELYKLSQRIISNQNLKIFNDWNVNVYKYMSTFYKSVDVQKVFGLNKVFKSLKQTLINLKWYNIEDYEMPTINDLDKHLYSKKEIDLFNRGLLKVWDRYVIPQYIKGIVNYCVNDTLGVCEIVYKKKDEIVLRFNISTKYDVNVLSSSRSNIADRLFGKFYCEASGVSYEEYNKGRTERPFIDIGACIANNIEFSSPELKELLFKLRHTRIHDTKGELRFVVKFRGNTYIMATGGLHSEDKPGKFISNDEVELIDADVTSYYPNVVRNNKIAPAHLDRDLFISTTSGIIDERVKAKSDGDVTKADALKIVINVGVFGKMGFPDSPAYDPKAMVEVTINGQLYLLMLIEMLTDEGFNVISANTDGIVTLVPRDKYSLYISICNNWEYKLNFNLEYTHYERYIRMNVNHYMVLKATDPTKSVPVKKMMKFKGIMNPYLYTEELTKGFNNPIVSQAVFNYYIKDIPIMDSLKECKDITEFCSTQKPGSKFNLELHNVTNGKHTIINLTKDVRFYVSKNQNKLLSGLLLKNDTTVATGGKRKLTNLVAGRNVTILNKLVDFDNFDDFCIDYGYYYSEVSKIINSIETNSNIKKVIKREYGQYKLGF